jgi:small conductance mechanosensitive channel
MKDLLLALAVPCFALSLLALDAAIASDSPGDAPGQELADPLAVEAADLIERLQEARARRQELRKRASQETGEPRRILEEQAYQRQREAQALFAVLAENLVQQQEAGRDVSDTVARMRQRLDETWPVWRAQIERLEEEGDRLIEAIDAAGPDEALVLFEERDAHVRRIRGEYRLLVELVRALERVGMDVTTQRTYATERLRYWGEYLSAGVRVSTEQRDHLRGLLRDDPGNAELETSLDAALLRLNRVVQTLSGVTTLLGDLGEETAAYRQQLFEATGEVTIDVLDTEVALGLLDAWRARVTEALVEDGARWAMKALVFVMILAAFRFVASLVRRLVLRSVSHDRVQVSQLLRDTLVSWSSRTVMAIGLLVALGQLGVAIGPLLAGLGIAGFVLGFALQDSLSNFAAGAMILMYRPYDVGDLIEAAGVRGRVSAMNLVSTTVLTIDNRTLIVPNSKIWGDVILNETAQKLRRIDLVFSVSYATDVDQAAAVFRDVLAKHELVLDHPEPIVEVQDLGDSSVDFAVRPWVRTDDYWPAFWSLHREVKKRLDAERISIPFPQRDVHVRVVKEISD